MPQIRPDAAKKINKINKYFLKVQYDKHTQQIRKSRKELPHHVKCLYKNSTGNIIPNGKRLNAFLVRSGKRKDVHPHHFYSALYCMFWPGQLEEKEIGIQTGKKEVKLLLFADGMILCIEKL